MPCEGFAVTVRSSQGSTAAASSRKGTRSACSGTYAAASKPTNAAPISPAAVASSARTTRTRSRIGRSASRRITSSAAGITCSQPATPKPPPITISSGPKTFAKEPIAEPRCRPMSARIERAVSSPSFASRISLCASAAGPNASSAAAVAARPVTYGSRCPRPVQTPRQGLPSWTITTWPSSAPRPFAPRNGRPPEITPPPSPVPSVSITRSSTPRPTPARHSPIAAAFASLSSPTARPKRFAMCSRSAKSARGRFTHSTTTPAARSIGDGIPKPTAPTSSVSSSSTAASSSATTEDCESCGVGRSWRRTTRPSCATTPARIFVPPTSTPIACVALISSGYRNPPNGRRRQAVPRLQGRPHQGKGAAADGRRGAQAERAARRRDRTVRPPRAHRLPRRRGRRRPPGRQAPEALDLEALDLGDAARARRPLHRVGRCRLLLGPQRRRRREQAAAGRGDGRAREAELAARLDRDEHPPARHRPFDQRAGGTEHGRAFRFDDAAPYRPEPAPARLPLDPTRPARGDPRLRRAEDQCGDAARRAEARDRDRRRPARLGPEGQPCRRRRLRDVPEPRRRRGRDRHQRAGEHPLEPLRLSVLDAGPLSALEGLVLPQGRSAPERAPGADLLADPREPARSVVHRLHASAEPAAGDAGDALEARELLDVPPAAVQRQRPDEAARDGPFHLAAAAARLGEVPCGLRPPLPARRARLRRRLHHARPGQHRGDPGGARPLGAAAAGARLGSLRARLRHWQPELREGLVARGRSRGLRLGRLGVALRGLGLRLAAARVAFLRRRLALAVVGRVEARALVVDRDRVEHELDRRHVADVAALGRGRRHRLEALERMPVRAAVLVNRHSGRRRYQRRPL